MTTNRPKLTLIVCNDDAPPSRSTAPANARRHARPAMPAHYMVPPADTSPDDDEDEVPEYDPAVRKKILAMRAGSKTVRQRIASLQMTVQELIAAGVVDAASELLKRDYDNLLKLQSVGIEAGVYTELGKHELIVRVLYLRRLRNKMPELCAVSDTNLYAMPLI